MLNPKNVTLMERIDLFDRYIFGQLSKEEKESLELRLATDAELASEYNTYLLCVKGIRNEVEQDDIEFCQAMKGLSREELSEIIGKQSVSMSREHLIEKLRGGLTSAAEERTELSGMAALSNDLSEDDEIEIPELKTDSETGKVEKEDSLTGNFRLITLIFIAIILIALIVSLFI
jgi:ethanolamine utilization cobalamin adenosyltransferase